VSSGICCGRVFDFSPSGHAVFDLGRGHPPRPCLREDRLVSTDVCRRSERVKEGAVPFPGDHQHLSHMRTIDVLTDVARNPRQGVVDVLISKDLAPADVPIGADGAHR
jgi:hypothetical protein